MTADDIASAEPMEGQSDRQLAEQRAEQLAERRAAVQKEFEQFSRKPFVELLAHAASVAPTVPDLMKFASEHPDKWASMLVNLSKLAGYHEKLEIKGGLHVTINQMGDSELLNELARIESEIEDVEYEDVTGDQEASTEAQEETSDSEPTPA